MTNKDKFLRDGVSTEEFIQKLTNHINKTQKSTYEKIKEFLEQPAQILTDDERVILRNIDNYRYETIKRVKGILVLFNVFTRENEETPFAENLFQFIKERRRI